MGLQLRYASRKNPQCISEDTPAVFSLAFLVSLPYRIPRHAATFESGSNNPQKPSISAKKPEAQEVCEDVNLRTKNFDQLCQELGPLGVLRAKYGVEVHNPHALSCVIPKGVSRIETIEEAQTLVENHMGRPLIRSSTLERWRIDPRFTAPIATSERFSIDGHFPNSAGKTIREQKELLGSEGERGSRTIEMATIQDLAVALHFVATNGQPLFGWSQESKGWSYAARAVGGPLGFSSYGLFVGGLQGNSHSIVVIAARTHP